jgi:hypothetical protein
VYDFVNQRIGGYDITESFVFDQTAAFVTVKDFESLEKKADNLRDDLRLLQKVVPILHRLQTRIAAADSLSAQTFGAVVALAESLGVSATIDSKGVLQLSARPSA